MAINRTPPLDERIANIQADLEAWIAARVAEERKRYPDLPDTSVRLGLTKGIGCLCAAYLEVKKQDDENSTERKL